MSDFVYDPALKDGQVEVMLMHGRTRVDLWSASNSWDSHYLRFIDKERRTVYRVRFANPPQSHDSGRKGE